MEQNLRYNERELSIIKNTFGNKDLLKSLRKFFLQTKLNAIDLSLLQTNINPEVNKILRKMFLPNLEDDVPYDQAWDLTASINFKERMAEDIILHIKANKIVIDHFDKRIKSLEKRKFTFRGSIMNTLSDIKDAIDKDIFINTLARTNILATTIGRLQALYALSQMNPETPEEIEQRKFKDSSK